jgi:glycosyltransferase involved in cell wall biosynthesis
MQTLSIIIPCYNEAGRLPAAMLTGFLDQHHEIRLVFVDDGSTDQTPDVIAALQSAYPDRVQLLQHKVRKGKAEAVRTGILQVAGQGNGLLGFIDADMAVTPDEFYRLAQLFRATDFRFYFGSRIKKVGADIKRNEWRHFYSRIIATIVGLLIRLDVYDTQCSAKLFTADTASAVFEKPFKTRWLFDVEIICRLHQLYGSLNQNGKEEPLLQWTEQKGSKIRWYHFFSILKEILVLKKLYY